MVEAVIWDFGGVLTTSPFEAFKRFETERGLPADIIRRTNAANHLENAWAKFERAEVDIHTFDELFATESRALGAEVRGKELVYLQELQKGQSLFTNLEGHGTSVQDYDIRVENRKTGAGVRQRGDRPLSKVVFWSIRSNVSPEPYIEMKIEPGKEERWSILYEFYKIPTSAAK